ncbi:MAG: hypothetical protein COA32_09620 [Fluviicola sp.]|nr:MAG: hypothetical protein COA32_09620 [Fluviicola sp.]
MRKFLFLPILLVAFNLGAQIITDDSETDEQEEAPEKTKEVKEKNGFELYFGVSPCYTFRTLTPNDNLFGEELGEREFEEAAWTTSYAAGVRSELNKNLLFEIGVGYTSNREAYDYTTTDSVYRYVNTYRHISFPIRVAYTYGNEISFYGGIGVMPKAFLSLKREITTLDLNDNEVTEDVIVKDKFNFFVIDAIATLGTRVQLNPHYGIFAMLEGRRQLTNNYNEQGPYIRKPYAFGFNFGIQIYL